VDGDEISVVEQSLQENDSVHHPADAPPSLVRGIVVQLNKLEYHRIQQNDINGTLHTPSAHPPNRRTRHIWLPDEQNYNNPTRK